MLSEAMKHARMTKPKMCLKQTAVFETHRVQRSRRHSLSRITPKAGGLRKAKDVDKAGNAPYIIYI